MSGPPSDPARALLRVRAVLAVALVAGVALLLLAPKPWSSGVALKLREGGDLKSLDYAVTWLWWEK